MYKVGSSVVGSKHEFYSEIDALKNASFDVEDWLKEKGDDDESKLDFENQRLIQHSLKDIYSVPSEPAVSAQGSVSVNFSSRLKPLSYDEISKRFIWLYTDGTPEERRNLQSSEV